MKYIGNKSVSSVMEAVLKVSWFGVLFGSIFLGLILSILVYTGPVKKNPETIVDHVKSEIHFKMDKENDKDWQEFKKVPQAGKMVILPYLSILVVLLLFIIKNGQKVFKNFKNNEVFQEGNVVLLSKTSKLLIWFSVLSFNFASLMVSIILLIFTDIFKSGTALQEEHDLTV